ncbi:hypothetical protein V6Z11_A11G080100 [Gossypium hirsutum]|uniref:Metalloendoproteinase 1-MMP-like n=2 Tax=Gossypium TaxID=3633 RepID=A0A1U8L7U6_GOSHI|nr:metalloendoproteinase 1-MMP-like [Gossypium hirsutum]TYG93098.1 hypothetical protein ES288_A11G083600v1 [Gossypium darwinii]
MAATISNQLFGAFLMFLVLQPFVAKSRPVKFDHGHNNVKQSPGCGITHGKSDGVFHLVENYSFFNGDPKWENFPVTYGFRSGFSLPAGLDSQEVEDAIDAAVLEWQTTVPKFAFQKVEPGDGADINIAFAELSGTKYGFAYAPPNGSLFLDIDTNWSTSSNPGTLQLDLQSGAMHEIGHTLGLGS